MSYKIIDKWITPNKYSRPQTKLNPIKGIVIHWIAVANGKAIGVYNFFEGRKNGANGFGSAHETIDLDGSVWRMIPETELAYHVGAKSYKVDAVRKLSSNPNNCTYGIECTHIDANGKMSDATYATLVNRVVDLCKQWKLTENDLYLHFHITGKDCHKWFVNNPKEWDKFKELVKQKINPPKPIAQPTQPAKPTNTPQYPSAKVVFDGRTVEAINMNGTTRVWTRNIGNLLGVSVDFVNGHVVLNNKIIPKEDVLLLDGKSYMATRKIAEMLGLRVKWIDATKTVELSK